MTLYAQIKFTQGAVVGTAGVALVGEVGTLVTVDHDPGVNPSDPPGSWEITLHYAPPGSSYEPSVPVVLGGANTSTPSATFTPDVTGSYRVQLTIWASSGQTGASSTDIRAFVIREPKHGFVVPPYQQDPAPLPTPASGAATARPNELNVGGQPLGWTGKGVEGLLADFIKQVDTSNFDIIPDLAFAGGVLRSASAVADFGFPLDAVPHGDSIWVVNSGLGNSQNLYADSGLTRISKTSNKITERLVAPTPLPSTILAYAVSSGDQLWGVGIKTDGVIYIDLVLIEILVAEPGTSAFGTITTLISSVPPNGYLPTGAVFDSINNKIWVSASGQTGSGAVIGIPVSTMTPDTPLTAPANSVGPLVLDTVTSHYGDAQPRLFLGDAPNGLVHRINNLSTAAALETNFAVTAAKEYVLAIGGGGTGVGGGRIYTGGMDTGTFESYTTAGVAITSTVSPPIFSLTYEASNDAIIFAVQNVDHIELGIFDAAAVTPLFGPLELPAHNETTGPGLGAPIRYAIDAGSLWALSPGTDAANGAYSTIGRVFKTSALNLSTLEESVRVGTVELAHADRVLWRLDGTGTVSTWSEVMTAIEQNKTPVTIVLDQPGVYLIPPGAPGPTVTYDMKGARFEAKEGPYSEITVTVQRYAVLRDLAGHFGGMCLQHEHALADGVGSPIVFTAAIEPVYRVGKGAALMDTLSGAVDVPAITVSNLNPQFFLIFEDQGTAKMPTGATASTVYVDAGGVANIIVVSGGLGRYTKQDAGWLGSDVTAFVHWVHDGSMAFPVDLLTTYHPNNAGTQYNKPLGIVGGAGETAHRPVYQDGGNPSIGTIYYNTQLGGYEYFDSSLTWVALGSVPGFEDTSNYLVGVGATALDSATSGTYSTAVGHNALTNLTIANYCVAVGSQALMTVVDGDNNVAVGHNAGGAVSSGYNNTFIGTYAGNNVTTGAGNIIIGSGVPASSAGASVEINIGRALRGVCGDGSGDGYVTFLRSCLAAITASTTQAQGNGPLTYDVNAVQTVANAGDTCTAPAAVAGKWFRVINNGANTMRLYPASGDNLGAGVNAYVTLVPGEVRDYWAHDTTNWTRESPRAHAASHQNGGTDEIATATPGANAIPKAGSGGKLATGWIPALGLTWENKTASFNAAAFYGYRIGVLAANCTITLPASPATDDIIIVAGALDVSTYSCTVDGNGNTINGDATKVLTSGESLTLTFDGTGWRII